jgi:hypothetical protein
VTIILSGTATVLFSDRNLVVHEIIELRHGEVFGHSDLLQVAGFEYFGSIRANEGLECLVIDNPDHLFELYERQLLRSVLSESTHACKSIMESKFRYLPAHSDLYHFS